MERVIEIRHEGPGDGYVLNGKLKVGSSLDDCLQVLGQPKEIIENNKISWSDCILYKDVEGRKGYCYYHRKDKNVRMFFLDYKIHALYQTRSDYRD